MRYEFTVPLELPDNIEREQLQSFEEWGIEAISLAAKALMTSTSDPVIQDERTGLKSEREHATQ